MPMEISYTRSQNRGPKAREDTATPKDGREQWTLRRPLPSPAVAEKANKASGEQEIGGGLRDMVGGRWGRCPDCLDGEIDIVNAYVKGRGSPLKNQTIGQANANVKVGMHLAINSEQARGL